MYCPRNTNIHDANTNANVYTKMLFCLKKCFNTNRKLQNNVH